MEVTINADQMDEIFDKTANLITEALLRFTEDGLEMTTADPAMVGMVHLEVPADSFESYEIDSDSEEYEEFTRDGEEGMLVGINLENLATVVDLFDEEITITLDENEVVLTEGSDRFQLPVLNLSTDDIPSMEALDDHSFAGQLGNSEFKTLRKKMAVGSDTAKMTFNSDGELEVEGGGDQISVETSFDLDDVEVFEDDNGDEPDSATSMFALDYVKKAQQMFDNLDSCDDVRIKIGDDFPMTLIHESDRENLKFILAPRIEEQ